MKALSKVASAKWRFLGSQASGNLEGAKWQVEHQGNGGQAGVKQQEERSPTSSQPKSKPERRGILERLCGCYKSSVLYNSKEAKEIMWGRIFLVRSVGRLHRVATHYRGSEIETKSRPNKVSLLHK